MRSEQEISDMRDQLEDNIREHNWGCAVDAASMALAWAFGASEAPLRRYMDQPESDRRREWIAQGGDPEAWPESTDGGEQS